MATDRFPGYRGKYFSVGENRNVLPKPLQKPHPPFWDGLFFAGEFSISLPSTALEVLSFNIAKADPPSASATTGEMIANRPLPVVAKVNNQVAVFLMTLCGERNDETVEMAGEGMAWYMGVLRGQSPYWMNIFERQRHEVFANVESYAGWLAPWRRCCSSVSTPTRRPRQEAMKPRNLVNMGLLCAGNPEELGTTRC